MGVASWISLILAPEIPSTARMFAISEACAGPIGVSIITMFFKYVRTVNAGEIRCLEFRQGLPFSMEIEHRANATQADLVETACGWAQSTRILFQSKDLFILQCMQVPFAPRRNSAGYTSDSLFDRKGEKGISCADHQVLPVIQQVRLRSVADVCGETSVPQDLPIGGIIRDQMLRIVAGE